MVKAPLLNNQLSAVEPLIIIILAVPEPKVTDETVMLLFAVKSVTAAKTNTGRSRDRTIAKDFLIMVIIMFRKQNN
jgi:hypothetical protein